MPVDGGDVAVDGEVDGGVVLAATDAGSKGYRGASKSLEQFQPEQRVEHICQEMINLFGDQKAYVKNMNANVEQIAAQTVICSSFLQRHNVQHSTTGYCGTLNMEAGTMKVMVNMRTGGCVKLCKNYED